MEVSVKRQIELDATREEVWRALTEPEQLREWLANDAELDVRPGGTGRFRWEDGEERRAVVEEVELERRLVFAWGEGEEATRVELTLVDAVAGTRLSVSETPLGPRACAGSWSWAVELRLPQALVVLV